MAPPGPAHAPLPAAVPAASVTPGAGAGRLRGARDDVCLAPLCEAATAVAHRDLRAVWEARCGSWPRTSSRDFKQLQAAAGRAGSRWGRPRRGGRSAQGAPGQQEAARDRQRPPGSARAPAEQDGGALPAELSDHLWSSASELKVFHVERVYP